MAPRPNDLGVFRIALMTKLLSQSFLVAIGGARPLQLVDNRRIAMQLFFIRVTS
jgi:hypothetical protein